jgi:hypothetical protein
MPSAARFCVGGLYESGRIIGAFVGDDKSKDEGGRLKDEEDGATGRHSDAATED